MVGFALQLPDKYEVEPQPEPLGERAFGSRAPALGYSTLATILRRFEAPDETHELSGGRLELVSIAGVIVRRAALS